MERESMPFDVVIVGAGPAGLASACRLGQLNQEHDLGLEIAVLEKGSEVGAHIVSGAVLDPKALNELFPNWQELNAPLNTPVIDDEIYYFLNEKTAISVPHLLVPKDTHNDGNYVISLGNVCRWLAEQAEALGVTILPEFSATEVLYDDNGAVKGVATGDKGVSASGEKKGTFEAGYELLAKYTLFTEGCRGQLGKQLIEKFALDQDSGTQHYGIGLKEIWQIDPSKHQPGLVVHSVGWPLDHFGATTGGGFLYHLDNHQVAVGLIIDLSYANPHLSPFDEFQRFKHQAKIKHFLEGGERICYGARALTKGGLQAVPKLTFKGGLLAGCEAGFMNFLRIKGSHTAMKTGMLAAETIADALKNNDPGQNELTEFTRAYKNSWVYDELYKARNIGPMIHKAGMLLGSAYAFIDQRIFAGRLPFTLSDPQPDYATLKPANQCQPIHYPKPDGKISFEKLGSVFISNTNHAEDQPCHLLLKDADTPIKHNLPLYNEPATRYCPAGVYEIVENDAGQPSFQINSQNCVHCKTCDIKDPAQNITWVSPEGGGGPRYPNM